MNKGGGDARWTSASFMDVAAFVKGKPVEMGWTIPGTTSDVPGPAVLPILARLLACPRIATGLRSTISLALGPLRSGLTLRFIQDRIAQDCCIKLQQARNGAPTSISQFQGGIGISAHTACADVEWNSLQ